MEGRFSAICVFFVCYPTLCQLRALYKGTGNEGPTASGSTNFIRLTVGTVECRSFRDCCLILCFFYVMSTPGPVQGHRSRVPSRTHSPQKSQ